MDLINAIKKAGHTYKRFHDRGDLKPEIMRALIRTLAEEFGICASPAEVDESEHLIEAASTFETTALPDIPVSALDQKLIEAYATRISADTDETWTAADVLRSRGLAIRGDETMLANAAAVSSLRVPPGQSFPSIRNPR